MDGEFVEPIMAEDKGDEGHKDNKERCGAKWGDIE